MKKHSFLKKYNFIGFFLVLFMVVMDASPVYATGLESTITDLESQQKETKDAIEKLKGQKSDSEENVDTLKDQSQDLQDMYNSYSAEMATINGEIDQVQASLQETSGAIVSLNDELRKAQEEENRIYCNLKNCLEASYENGSRDSMVLLLYSSTSMQDFLTKAEYVTALLLYQQNLVDSYKNMQADISKKIEQLNAKQSELDSYQDELDSKQEELSALTQKVQGELSDTNSDLAQEKDKLKDFDKQISELDKKMEGLLSQQAAAQAELAKQMAEQQAAMEASGQKEDLSGSYAASASELEWLAATIQAEADGESYTGKLAVGTVIMNRVKSSKFPNTVTGVITQTNQFASYRSGKVELILAKGPNSTCTQAAQEVLNGARVGEYLFFMTKYYADYYNISEYTMIGNHAFFYRWVTKEAVPVTPAPDENTPDTTSDTNTTNTPDVTPGTDTTNTPDVTPGTDTTNTPDAAPGTDTTNTPDAAPGTDTTNPPDAAPSADTTNAQGVTPQT